jgi:hypothetical protein
VQTIAFPHSQAFVRAPGQFVVTLQTSQSQGGLARSDDGRLTFVRLRTARLAALYRR